MAWEDANPGLTDQFEKEIRGEITAALPAGMSFQAYINSLDEAAIMALFDRFINKDRPEMKEAITKYRAERERMGNVGGSGAFEADANLVRNQWIRVFARIYNLDYVTRFMLPRTKVKGSNLDNATDPSIELTKMPALLNDKVKKGELSQKVADGLIAYSTKGMQVFAPTKFISEYVFVLDADTEITADKDDAKNNARKAVLGISNLARNEKLGYIQFESYTIDPDETYMKKVKQIAEEGYWSYFLPLRQEIGFVPCNGHNTLIRTKMIQQIGGWAPEGKKLVAEDLYLVFRAGNDYGWKGEFGTWTKLGEGSPHDWRSIIVQQFKFGVGSPELFVEILKKTFKDWWAGRPSLLLPRERVDILVNLAKFVANAVIFVMYPIAAFMMFLNINILYSSLIGIPFYIIAGLLMLSPNWILIALAMKGKLAKLPEGIEWEDWTALSRPQALAEAFKRGLKDALSAGWRWGLVLPALYSPVLTVKRTFTAVFDSAENGVRLGLNLVGASKETSQRWLAVVPNFRKLAEITMPLMFLYTGVIPAAARGAILAMYKSAVVPFLNLFEKTLPGRSVVALTSLGLLAAGIYGGILTGALSVPATVLITFLSLGSAGIIMPQGIVSLSNKITDLLPKKGRQWLIPTLNVVLFGAGIYGAAAATLAGTAWAIIFMPLAVYFGFFFGAKMDVTTSTQAPFPPTPKGIEPSKSVFELFYENFFSISYAGIMFVPILLSYIMYGSGLMGVASLGLFLIPLFSMILAPFFFEEKLTFFPWNWINRAPKALKLLFAVPIGAWIVFKAVTELAPEAGPVDKQLFPKLEYFAAAMIGIPKVDESQPKAKFYQWVENYLKGKLGPLKHWRKAVIGVALLFIFIGAPLIKDIHTYTVMTNRQKAEETMDLYLVKQEQYLEGMNWLADRKKEADKAKRYLTANDILVTMIEDGRKILETKEELFVKEARLAAELKVKDAELLKLLNLGAAADYHADIYTMIADNLIPQDDTFSEEDLLRGLKTAYDEELRRSQEYISGLKSKLQTIEKLRWAPAMKDAPPQKLMELDEAERFIKEELDWVSKERRDEIYPAKVDMESRLSSGAADLTAPITAAKLKEYEIKIYGPIYRSKRFVEWQKRVAIGRVEALERKHAASLAANKIALEKAKDARERAEENVKRYEEIIALNELQLERDKKEIDRLRDVFFDYAQKVFVADPGQFYPIMERLFDLQNVVDDPLIALEVVGKLQSNAQFYDVNRKALIDQINAHFEPLRKYNEAKKQVVRRSLEIGIPVEGITLKDLEDPIFVYTPRFRDLMVRDVRNNVIAVQAVLAYIDMDRVRDYLPEEVLGVPLEILGLDITKYVLPDLDIGKLKAMLREFSDGTKEADQAEREFLEKDPREIKRGAILQMMAAGIPFGNLTEAEARKRSFIYTYKFSDMDLRNELNYLYQIDENLQRLKNGEIPEEYFLNLYPQALRDAYRSLGLAAYADRIDALKKEVIRSAEVWDVRDRDLNDLLAKLRKSDTEEKDLKTIPYLKEMRIAQINGELKIVERLKEGAAADLRKAEMDYNESLGEFEGAGIEILKVQLEELVKTKTNELVKEFKTENIPLLWHLSVILQKLENIKKVVAFDLPEVRSESGDVATSYAADPRNVDLYNNSVALYERRLAAEREVENLLNDIGKDLREMRDRYQVALPVPEDMKDAVGVADIFNYINSLRKDHFIRVAKIKRDMVSKQIERIRDAIDQYAKLPAGATLGTPVINGILKEIGITVEDLEKYALEAESAKLDAYTKLFRKIAALVEKGESIDSTIGIRRMIPAELRAMPPVEEPAVRAPKKAVSLGTLVAGTLENSENMNIAEEQLVQAAKKSEIAVRELYPEISTLVGLEKGRGPVAGLTVLDIKSPEKFSNSELARTEIQLKYANLEVVRRAEVAKAMRAWTELFATEVEIRAIDDFIKKQPKSIADAARAKYRSGTEDLTGLSASVKKLVELMMDRAAAIDRNEQAQVVIRSLMNLSDAAQVSTGIDLSSPESVLTKFNEALSSMDAHREAINPDLIFKKEEERYLKALLRAVERKMFPTVAVGAELLVSMQGGKLKPGAKGKIGISIPLWRDGQKAEKDKAKLDLKVLGAETEKTVRELQKREQDAGDMVQRASDDFNAAADSIKTNVAKLALTYNLYLKGSVSDGKPVDIGDVQRSLTGVQENVYDRISAVYEYAAGTADRYTLGEVKELDALDLAELLARPRAGEKAPAVPRAPITTISLRDIDEEFVNNYIDIVKKQIEIREAEAEKRIARKQNAGADLVLEKDLPGKFTIFPELYFYESPARRDAIKSAQAKVQMQMYSLESLISETRAQGFDLVIGLRGAEKRLDQMNALLETLNKSRSFYETRAKEVEADAMKTPGTDAFRLMMADVKYFSVKAADVAREVEFYKKEKVRLQREIEEHQKSLNAMLGQPLTTPIAVTAGLDDGKFEEGNLGLGAAMLTDYNREAEVKQYEQLIKMLEARAEQVKKSLRAGRGLRFGKAGLTLTVTHRGKPFNIPLPFKWPLFIFGNLFKKGPSKEAREKRDALIAQINGELEMAKAKLGEMQDNRIREALLAYDGVFWAEQDLDNANKEITDLQKKIQAEEALVKTGTMDEQSKRTARITDYRMQMEKLKLERTKAQEELNKANHKFARYRTIWEAEREKIAAGEVVKREIVIGDFITDYIETDPTVAGRRNVVAVEEKAAETVRAENKLQPREVIKAAEYIPGDLSVSGDSNFLSSVRGSDGYLQLKIEPNEIQRRILMNKKAESRVNQARAELRDAEFIARNAATKDYMDMVLAKYRYDTALKEAQGATKQVKVAPKDKKWDAELAEYRANEALKKAQSVYESKMRLIRKHLKGVTAKTDIVLKEDFSRISDTQLEDLLREQLKGVYPNMLPEIDRALEKVREGQIDVATEQIKAFKPETVNVSTTGIVWIHTLDTKGIKPLRIEIAKSALREDEAAARAAVNESEREIRLLAAQAQGAVRALELATLDVKVAKVLYDQTYREFKNDLKTADDMEIARRNYFAARLGQLNALIQFQTAKKQLDLHLREAGIEPDSVEKARAGITVEKVLKEPPVTSAPRAWDANYVEYLAAWFRLPSAEELEFVIGRLRATIQLRKEAADGIAKLIGALKKKTFDAAQAKGCAQFLFPRIEKVIPYAKDAQTRTKLNDLSARYDTLKTLGKQRDQMMEAMTLSKDADFRAKMEPEIQKISDQYRSEEEKVLNDLAAALSAWAKKNPAEVIRLLENVDTGYSVEDDIDTLRILASQGGDFLVMFRDKLDKKDADAFEELLVAARAAIYSAQSGERNVIGIAESFSADLKPGVTTADIAMIIKQHLRTAADVPSVAALIQQELAGETAVADINAKLLAAFKARADLTDITNRLGDSLKALMDRYTSDRNPLKKLPAMIADELKKVSEDAKLDKKEQAARTAKLTHYADWLEKQTVKDGKVVSRKGILPTYERLQRSLYLVSSAKTSANDFIQQEMIMREDTERRMRDADFELARFIVSFNKDFPALHLHFVDGVILKNLDDQASNLDGRIAELKKIEEKRFDERNLMALMKGALLAQLPKTGDSKTGTTVKDDKNETVKYAEDGEFVDEAGKTVKYQKGDTMLLKNRTDALVLKKVYTVIAQFEAVENARKNYYLIRNELFQARRSGDAEAEKRAWNHYKEWKVNYDSRLEAWRGSLAYLVKEMHRTHPNVVKGVLDQFGAGKLAEAEALLQRYQAEIDDLTSLYGEGIALSESFVARLNEVLKEDKKIRDLMRERERLAVAYEDYAARYELSVSEAEKYTDPVHADIQKKVDADAAVAANKDMMERIRRQIDEADDKIKQELGKPEKQELQRKFYELFYDITKDKKGKETLTTFGIRKIAYMARFEERGVGEGQGGIGDLFKMVRDRIEDARMRQSPETGRRWENFLRTLEDTGVIGRLQQAKAVDAQLEQEKSRVDSGELDIYTNEKNRTAYTELKAGKFAADSMARKAMEDVLNLFEEDELAAGLLQEWDRQNGIMENPENQPWFLRAFNQKLTPLLMKAMDKYQTVERHRAESHVLAARANNLRGWIDAVKGQEEMLWMVLVAIDPSAAASYIENGNVIVPEGFTVNPFELGERIKKGYENVMRRAEEVKKHNVPGRMAQYLADLQKYYFGGSLFEFQRELTPVLEKDREAFIDSLQIGNGLWRTAEKGTNVDLYTQARASLHAMSKGDYQKAKQNIDRIQKLMEKQWKSKELGALKGLIPTWFDDKGAVRLPIDTAVGNNAWYLISIHEYTAGAKDTAYVDMAKDMINGILARQKDNGGFATAETRGGKTAEFQSAEQNIDAYAALKHWRTYLSQDPANKELVDRIDAALKKNLGFFKDAVFDKDKKFFRKGFDITVVDGKETYQANNGMAVDVQAWTLLSGLFEDLAKEDPAAFTADLIFENLAPLYTDYTVTAAYKGKYGGKDTTYVTGIAANADTKTEAVNYEDTANYVLALKKGAALIGAQAEKLHAEGKHAEAQKLQKRAVNLINIVDSFEYELMESMTDHGGLYGLPMTSKETLSPAGFMTNPFTNHGSTSIVANEALEGFNAYTGEKIEKYRVISYETKKGETISDVSNNVFGDPNKTNEILKLNPQLNINDANFNQALPEGSQLLVPFFLGLKRYYENADEYKPARRVQQLMDSGFSSEDMTMINDQAVQGMDRILKGLYREPFLYSDGDVHFTLSLEKVKNEVTGESFPGGNLSFDVYKVNAYGNTVARSRWTVSLQKPEQMPRFMEKLMEERRMIAERRKERDTILAEQKARESEAAAKEKRAAVTALWQERYDAAPTIHEKQLVLQMQAVDYVSSMLGINTAADAVARFMRRNIVPVFRSAYRAVAPFITSRIVSITFLTLFGLMGLPAVAHASTGGAAVLGGGYALDIAAMTAVLAAAAKAFTGLFAEKPSAAPALVPAVPALPLTPQDVLVSRGVDLLKKESDIGLNDRQAKALLSKLMTDLLDQAEKTPRVSRLVQSLVLDMLPNVPKEGLSPAALDVLAKNNAESYSYLRSLISKDRLISANEDAVIKQALTLYSVLGNSINAGKTISERDLMTLKEYFSTLGQMKMVNAELQKAAAQEMGAVAGKLAQDAALTAAARTHAHDKGIEGFVRTVLVTNAVPEEDKDMLITAGTALSQRDGEILRDAVFDNRPIPVSIIDKILPVVLKQSSATVEGWMSMPAVLVAVLIEDTAIDSGLRYEAVYANRPGAVKDQPVDLNAQERASAAVGSAS